jgi:hypothetical protein
MNYGWNTPAFPRYDDIEKEQQTAEWILKMRRHYAETGTYLPSDLRRFLGDPLQRVNMSSEGARLQPRRLLHSPLSCKHLIGIVSIICRPALALLSSSPYLCSSAEER